MPAKLERIDRDTAKRVRVLIQGALSPVLRDLGLSVEVGNISFTPTTMTITVHSTLVPEDTDPGDKNAIQKAQFLQYIEAVGGKKEWYGMTIKIGDDLYEVIGVKPTARKNRLVISRLKDDKEFVCPVKCALDSVKNGTAVMVSV